MYVVSLSNQKFLFSNGTERFTLDGREVAPNAPEWLMSNHYALKLKEQGKVAFEIKKKLTPREKLIERANKLGLIFGDDIKVGNLEKMIEAKEKELKDDKK